MRILVVSENGSEQMLELDGDYYRAVDGERLNRLTDGQTDLFFTKDGHYDGWGSVVSEGPIPRPLT